MRRRDFIKVIAASGVAWPRTARAQRPNMPVIGILSAGSPDSEGELVAAFTRSLSQAGYVDGNNIALEYRWANNRFDRLPALAADLARQHVTVIHTVAGTITVLAAKGVTQTIPIVFVTGGDPIKAGLVASLNRPGGNITGINLIAGALNEKRLELLHEVVPMATSIAVLFNPNNPNAEPEIRRVQAASSNLGLQIHTFEASRDRDIDSVYAEAIKLRAGAMLVFTDPLLNRQVDQIVALSARYGIPAIYGYREFTAAGGLMSYGTSQRDAQRLAALQVVRILQGEKPGELPVQQSTKIELVINLKTAKTLGLTFPLSLLGRADETID
jgi:ABC-type uncharacterized transport system substrate-binding protein